MPGSSYWRGNRQRGLAGRSESARHPDRFCPRCQLRITADNPIVGEKCSWCAAEAKLGRCVTYADLKL